MMVDSAIICFHFRKIHLPISLKITAFSLIRNGLAITLITLTDLLKNDLTFLSNIFSGPFDADFAAANAFFLLLPLVVVAVAVVVLAVVVVAVGVVVMVVVVVLVTVVLIVLVAVVVVKS